MLFIKSEIIVERELFQLQNFILLSLFHARYHIGDLKKYIESYLNGADDKGHGGFKVKIPDVLAEEVNTTTREINRGEDGIIKEQSPFAIQIYIQLVIEYLLGDDINGIKGTLTSRTQFFTTYL